MPHLGFRLKKNQKSEIDQKDHFDFEGLELESNFDGLYFFLDFSKLYYCYPDLG